MTLLFSFLITIFFCTVLLIFGVLAELFNPYIFDSILVNISKNTKINTLQNQVIFFFSMVVIAIFLIITLYKFFLPYVDGLGNHNLAIKIVMYTLAIIGSLFVLFAFVFLIIMSFKTLLNLLISSFDANNITTRLVNVSSLRSAIYKLSLCKNFAYITNENWNLIWESITTSYNNNVLYLKNSLFNQYNSLINILESANFRNLLESLKNIDLNNIARIKDILSSNNALQHLDNIYSQLENLNLTFINLKNELSSSEANFIFNSLPLFNQQINFNDFLSNIDILNIRANVVSNILLDSNNNVVFDINIATLIYSFLTGLYVNNLQGLYNMMSISGKLVLLNFNNLKNLIAFFLAILFFSVFTIYLMRKLTKDFLNNIKNVFVQIFKRPKQSIINENYYYCTHFTEWYMGMLGKLFNCVFIIFLDFLITLIVLISIKLITTSNIDISYNLSANMLIKLSFCSFLFFSTILSDLIFKCLERHFEIKIAKKIVKEYKEVEVRKIEIIEQISQKHYKKNNRQL